MSLIIFMNQIEKLVNDLSLTKNNMKRIISLFFVGLFVLNFHLHAQYVSKTEGAIWGAKENKYSELGNQVLNCMDNQLYSNAIDLLKQMIALKSRNENIGKDYYTLAYCYRSLEDRANLDKTTKELEAKIGVPNNDEDRFYLKTTFFNNGMELAFSKKPSEALKNLEKSILYSKTSDYKNISQCRFLMSKCYLQLDNIYQAHINMKKAINNRFKEMHYTIEQIENQGVNDPWLGSLFYDFRIFVADSYKAFVYLGYLAGKCNYEKALDDNPYALQDPTIINGHPTDLFEE